MSIHPENLRKQLAFLWGIETEFWPEVDKECIN